MPAIAMPAKQQKVICKIHCGHKGNGNWKFIYFTYEYWSHEHQTVFLIRKSSFSYKVTVDKVLFTIRYTNRQITALTFFAITKTLKTITKIAGKWDCWVCQIFNSLILKIKNWI